MTFMDRIIADSLKLWEDAANEDFLEKMGTGTLEKERFYDYIVQDSIYLRDYLKAFAMAIFKSRSLREMQVFYSVLGFVNDSENATRLRYLADNGMTDDDVEKVIRKPACAAYTSFLTGTAEKKDIPEILMAVMPCMLGYHFVFSRLLERHPGVLDTYYGPLVADYTSSYYKECCDYWTSYCNEVCSGLCEEYGDRLVFPEKHGKDVHQRYQENELAHYGDYHAASCVPKRCERHLTRHLDPEQHRHSHIYPQRVGSIIDQSPIGSEHMGERPWKEHH